MTSEGESILHYYKGPQCFPAVVTDAAIDAVKKFKYRDDDILIATYPKCGTHWINEVVQLMIHDGDPTKLDHRHRRPVFEVKDKPDFSKSDEGKAGVELVEKDPSPRVITTHLETSYLSQETWEKKIPVTAMNPRNGFSKVILKPREHGLFSGAVRIVRGGTECCVDDKKVGQAGRVKIIYVFRDPRDVALSCYEFLKHLQLREGEPFLQGKTFEEYLQDYIEGKVPFGGWCEYALSYEERRKQGGNILFIYYEDMKQDLVAVIKAIARHVKRPVSDEVVRKTVENSTVDAMRKNYAEAAKKKDKDTIDLSSFVKTGVSGKWKKEHSEDQWRELNEVFKGKVKETRFAKRYFV